MFEQMRSNIVTATFINAKIIIILVKWVELLFA